MNYTVKRFFEVFVGLASIIMTTTSTYLLPEIAVTLMNLPPTINRGSKLIF